MKYKMYLSTVFMAFLLLPLLSAKTNEIESVDEFDISSVEFIEFEDGINLGFDSSRYLPKDFDPYTSIIQIESIDFIENEEVHLDFNTEDYLPEGFNAYKE
ncbi:hypothetical protein [Croceivirga thetidis]|uniref:Secreted protein n=1 Tax=Croceivirga thetidis TaxID=2721623 RepID=A0ABX1GPK9_9FLAO|nr:hypothetical protein [Croceivirga thetidis]NKI31839.1 hypothetical protein [Croceivirga thetidis]